MLVQGTPVGMLGELHPDVQRAFGLPAPVYVAEVSLDALEALPSRAIQHQALVRYPGVQRDLAVVIPVGVPSADVGRAIEAIRAPALRRVVLFDVYEGPQVGPGRKSLAYGLLYQADDRTLTDAEVNRAHADVVERLRAELGAEVRGADGVGEAAAQGETGMTDDAQARLTLLEEHVQRAIELIGTLRAENARLTTERRSLDGRVADLTAEAEGLRTRLAVIGRLETEQRRLLDERRQLLGQVEGILKDLARIEGL